MKEIKVAFAGTPDFALPALKALVRDTDFKIMAVITQPDVPVGRKQIISFSAVKELALKYNLPVLQPQKIIQIKDQLRAMQLDLLVVVAYAQIIPKDILNLPQYGCLNIHGSLLPKYRGAAVIQAPLLNGDSETGITIMLMDEHLDTGPILRQSKIEIIPEENAQSLSEKLSKLGSKLLTPTIKDYLQGKIKPEVQDEAKASYVKKITKADGLIDWSRSAVEIERFVRAMNSWPSAWTWIKGKQLKIIKVQHQTIPINSQKIGKTFLYNKGLAVQCGQDALIIEKLQMEGKNELTSQEFLNGNKDFIGSILG